MKLSDGLHKIKVGVAQILPIFTLFTLQTVMADPVPYRFMSLFQQNTAINAFDAQFPSINNQGTVVALFDGNQSTGEPHTLIMFEGMVMTEIADVLPATPGGFANASGTDINDAGQVAVKYGQIFGGPRGLRRYEPDGTFVELVTGYPLCELNAFCEINLATINNAGQLAGKASFNFGGNFPVQGIYLFDDTGPVELARFDSVNPGGLFNLQDPSINDSGVVAFGANAVAPGAKGVYTATVASPPILEAALSIGGDTPINNSGQIAAIVGGNCAGVVVVDGGVVTLIKSPNECAGVFQSPSRVSLNNLGHVVFSSSGFNQFGLFTGGDEVNDVVIRNGDALFGGTVAGGTRIFSNALNDVGEISFAVQISIDGSTQSHLVRAIPLSSDFDSEGDGVANDIDNCLIVSNPSQIDADGDGYGNICDGDVNNDGDTNFADLAVIGAAFLSSDPTSDLNGDGGVNFADIFIFASLFLTSPGPSALVE